MLWNSRWFPGTNLQDINLDWILKKVSALRGGRAGQYLYKKSDKDFDFGWSAGGGGGENGYTFTPSVSEEGVISWTNDGDLPNPEPVNIMGPQGETGPGVPAGGADGDVLIKNGATDYAARWTSTPPQMGSLAMIETSPAQAAHEVGDYIVYKGQLYIVTVAISAGESLAVGTNIRARTAGAGIINKERYHRVIPATNNRISVPSGTLTNITSLTLPYGLYLFIYEASFDSNANGYRQMGIALNETTYNWWRLAITRVQAATGASVELNSCFVAEVLPTTGSTTFYLNVMQNSGSTLTVNGAIQALELERY